MATDPNTQSLDDFRSDVQAWIAENLGPQAQLRSAVEEGLDAARRLPQLVERAERTLEAVASGGVKLDPGSLQALGESRGSGSGRLLPWGLCVLLAGLLLGMLIA